MVITNQPKIAPYEPWLGVDEKVKLCECIDDNWITGGKKVKEFESRIAGMVGVKHAIACTNGSSALLLSLKAMGIKEGDEVLVPDFTFAASAFSVNWAGGTPVFVDVRKDTFNIDIDDCKRKLTKRTKAIMPVHIYGQSADMRAVLKFALEYGLLVIEDAAQGVGVTFEGHLVGGIGDIGIHSYYGDKSLTSGEGGMVLTNNDEYAAKVNRINNQGRDGRGWYVHAEIGLNFRMTDLQAAIGLAQLDKLRDIITFKREHDALYRKLLSDTEGVSLTERDFRSSSVPFRHNILVDDPQGLQDFLKAKGIGSTRFFYPLHSQPCYNQKGSFPNTEWANAHGLSLPSSVTLTDETIGYICESVKEYLNAK